MIRHSSDSGHADNIMPRIVFLDCAWTLRYSLEDLTFDLMGSGFYFRLIIVLRWAFGGDLSWPIFGKKGRSG